MDKLSVPIAIVIAGVLVAGALYYSNAKGLEQAAAGTTSAQTTPSATITMKPIDPSTDHILGNPNADVVMVEYSDTECPFCKAFYPTLQQIMSQYGASGQVAWVYRNFPIASLHSKAPKEAEALECANFLGGNTAFWKYTDEIYNVTNSNDSLDPSELPKIASDVGLNVSDFNNCLSSGKFTAQIQQDYNDAIAAGGQGTPYTILVAKDGTKVPIVGDQPYATVKADIDALLQKSQ